MNSDLSRLSREDLISLAESLTTARRMDGDQRPIVFAMDGATDIASGMEKWIRENWIPDFSISPHEEWRRHDRESYSRAQLNVRGRKCYVITSFATDDVRATVIPKDRFRVKTKKENAIEGVPAGATGMATWKEDHSIQVHLEGKRATLSHAEVRDNLHIFGETVDEKIWGTILFIHSLRDASCGDATLIGTCLPYMRQDEKDKPRAPIDTAAFVGQMKAAGVRRIITMDVHSKGAMQNASSAAGIGFDNLEAKCLLARAVAATLPPGVRVVVCAPDIGSSKRAAPEFQETLSRILGQPVGFAIAKKTRTGDTASELTTLIEDPAFPIAGSHVIAPDDILATGGTIRDVGEAVQRRGGTFWGACYTHGMFTGDAVAKLWDVPRLFGTRTVDPWRVRGTSLYERISWVDVSPVFARALMETHLNGSINALLKSLA